MKKWLQIKDSSTWIHDEWYQKGIVVLFNGTESELVEFDNKRFGGVQIAPTEHCLHFGSRHLEELSAAEIESNESVIASRHLLDSLQQNDKVLPGDMRVITNRDKNEVFFALPVDGPTSGSYLYPWLSSPISSASAAQAPFAGCTQFVSALCLFGASLSGKDANDYAIPLIKHDIAFAPGQKIRAIQKHSDNLYYKTLMQEELKHTLKIIKHHAAPSTPSNTIQLSMHVPYVDYILFGVRLYLRNQMRLSALKSLAVMVLEEKAEYQAIIEAQCKAAGITVKVVSPFERLIEGVDLSAPTDDVANKILGRLGLNSLTFTPSQDAQIQNQDELDFVNFCLHQLSAGAVSLDPEKKVGGRKPTGMTGNKFKIGAKFDTSQGTDESLVWRDSANVLKTTLQSNRKLGVEELLHTGNAAVVAFSARNSAPMETCSLLPVSEKQIQVGYQAFVNKALDHTMVTRETYPVILNLTTLDSVMAFDEGSFRIKEEDESLKANKPAPSPTNTAAMSLIGPRGSIFYTKVEKEVSLGLIDPGSAFNICQAHERVIGVGLAVETDTVDSVTSTDTDTSLDGEVSKKSASFDQNVTVSHLTVKELTCLIGTVFDAKNQEQMTKMFRMMQAMQNHQISQNVNGVHSVPANSSVLNPMGALSNQGTSQPVLNTLLVLPQHVESEKFN